MARSQLPVSVACKWRKNITINSLSFFVTLFFFWQRVDVYWGWLEHAFYFHMFWPPTLSHLNRWLSTDIDAPHILLYVAAIDPSIVYFLPDFNSYKDIELLHEIQIIWLFKAQWLQTIKSHGCHVTFFTFYENPSNLLPYMSTFPNSKTFDLSTSIAIFSLRRKTLRDVNSLYTHAPLLLSKVTN